jgi:3',5'-cyclic AMP phosphodiesterase CpdA
MKLIQFTDFHLRLTPAPESQFHVQPFWRGGSKELFARIKTLSAGADAIAFTGDASHGGGKQEVADFFDFLAETADGRPVFIVVGNHDVTHQNWEDHFQRGIEKYPNIKLNDGVYALGETDIALINNEYLTPRGDISTAWRDDCFPVPAMSEAHAARLHAALATSTTRPALALVHCPSHVLPATLFDFGTSVLAGMDRYRAALHGVLDQHPRISMVIAGHVHFNSARIYQHGRVHLSLASVSEYPFQVRIVDINGKRCHSRLVSAAHEEDAEEDFSFPEIATDC